MPAARPMVQGAVSRTGGKVDPSRLSVDTVDEAL
jgi:hypothetical protein